MADIIDVQFDIDKLKAQLAELDKSFGGSRNAAKQLGDEIQSALDASAKSVSDARQNIARLSTTIKEQENLTAEWKDEVKKLEAEYKRLGGGATIAGQRVGAEMKRTQAAIDDNVSAVRTLKLEQTKNRQVIVSQQKVTKELQNQKKELSNVQKESSKTDRAFQKLGARIAAVFAVDRLIRFASEAVRMADVFNGVEIAFDRIGISLESLREATRGTVTDLELMRAAVNARNLGVPVEEMAGLMEFAALRARETGESIDGLVQSIVTGLGRKSTLVLDNLGISAVELREALGDVSLEQASVAQLTAALNRVIERQGGALEDNTSKSQQLSVAFTNLQTTIGQKLLPVWETFAEAATDLITDLDNTASAAQDLQDVLGLSYWKDGLLSPQLYQELGEFQEELIKTKRDVERMGERGDVDGLADGVKALKFQMNLLNTTTEEGAAKFKLYQDAIDDILLSDLTRGIKELQKELQALDEAGNEGIVEGLKLQIEDLNKRIEISQSIEEINRLTDQRITKEERLDEILNSQIRKREAEKKLLEDIAAENRQGIDMTELGEDPLARLNAEMEAEAARIQKQEDTVDAIYEDALQNKIEKYQEDLRWAQYVRDQKAMLAQQEYQTAVLWANQVNATISALYGENAASQKIAAVFSALLNAFASVNNILATVPGPAAIPLSILVGIQAIAQVRKIQSTPVPSFFEGTAYLKRNGAPVGKDTIPVMAHEGEAIIPTQVNKSYPGLTDSLIKGDFDRYVTVKHVMPALKAQKQAMQMETAALTAQALKGTFIASLNDDRMVRQLKQGNSLTAEMINTLNKSNRKRNPYRA